MGTSYCDVAPGHEWHGPYHDTEYGFPLSDDPALFERLVLEINQAGLSWLTILKKREAFRRAYDGFDPEIVAGYRARDRRPCWPTPASSATASRWTRRSPTPRRSSSSAPPTAPSPGGSARTIRGRRRNG